MGKEIESVSDEEMECQGSSLLKEHQHLMLQHFGSKETSILPDHVVHRMLVGVSIYLDCSLNFDSSLTNFLFFLTLSLIFFFFQSTRTLELTLSLEAKVICLKQDALHLFNLALAGCACGALVDLFEATYGYPETEEQKA